MMDEQAKLELEALHHDVEQNDDVEQNNDDVNHDNTTPIIKNKGSKETEEPTLSQSESGKCATFNASFDS